MQTIVQDYLNLSPLKALEGKKCISEFAYEVADAMLMERKASSNTIKGRVEELEAQCKWAADQFQAIADSIASNSVGAAQGHALSCAADMEAALSDVIRSK